MTLANVAWILASNGRKVLVMGGQPGSPLSLLAAFERPTEAITGGGVTALPPMNEVTRLQSA